MREFLRNQLIKLIGKLRTPRWETTEEPLYRFITYHRIKPPQQVAFEQQLDRLQQHYNIVSPEDFENNRGKSNELNLVLTFDDGYLDWESIVVKELRRRDIQAIFFIVPDFVGLTGDAAEEFARNKLTRSPARALTPSGVEQLKSEGHTLGNHLIGHPDLREETNRNELEKQFEQSQESFGERFGIQPRWVAYPYANYFLNSETLSSTASQYFNYGVTLMPGWNHSDTDRLLLQRDGFSPELSPSVEQNWLKGGYEPIFRTTNLLRQSMSYLGF